MGRRVLLTSARAPGGWNGPADLPFRIRRESLGLFLLAENLAAPVLVAERSSRADFARLLERERFDVVGIGLTAPEVPIARDLARLVRLVLPTAHIMLGGPGAQVEGIAKLVDCDSVSTDDGIAAMRLLLGEDPSGPLKLPAMSGAAVLTTRGRSDLAMLVASAGQGSARRPLFETGEALFAEACRLADAVGTEAFYVPDEDLLASPELARGLLSAMEHNGRAFELMVHARADDLRAWAPQELFRLGVCGVSLAAQRWTPADAELVRGLQGQGIAVHATVLVDASTVGEELEAALALESDSLDFLPRYTLTPEASHEEDGNELLLDPRDEEAPTSLGRFLERTRAEAAERRGSPLLRLARTLLSGYRAHEFSDDAWMRRRAAQARRRLSELRLLLAVDPELARGPPEQQRQRAEMERDFAQLLGPDSISRRAVALGNQALKEFGTVVRRVRRAMDATKTQMRPYRWRDAAERRGSEAARRIRRFSRIS